MTPALPEPSTLALGAIQAVIFDCDGTLVDSEEPGIEVLRELAQELGLTLTREQAHAQFRGVRMAECITWIAAQLGGRPPGFEADFMQQVRATTEQRFRLGLAALPGAFELLSGLHIPFCVATNGPREKVELTLTLTGLRPLLGDRVFSAYEVGHYKPAPGLFLHAAQALGVAPACCAVVEDSVPGVQAGLAAGMQVYLVGDAAALPAELAARIVFAGSLPEIAERLRPG